MLINGLHRQSAAHSARVVTADKASSLSSWWEEPSAVLRLHITRRARTEHDDDDDGAVKGICPGVCGRSIDAHLMKQLGRSTNTPTWPAGYRTSFPAADGYLIQLKVHGRLRCRWVKVLLVCYLRLADDFTEREKKKQAPRQKKKKNLMRHWAAVWLYTMILDRKRDF